MNPASQIPNPRSTSRPAVKRRADARAPAAPREGPIARRPDAETAGPSRRNSLLLALLVIAFLVRVCFDLAMSELGRMGMDYREYATTATRLLEHGTFTSPIIFGEREAEPSYLLPPVYTLLVAGVYGVLGVQSFAATLVLQLINAVASALIVLLVFRIADALAGRRAAWIAAVVAAFNPLLFGFTGLVWDTYLLTLGAIFAVQCSMKLGGRQVSAWSMLAFGFYLGALALLNPAFTFVYPFLVLWPCVRHRLPLRRTAALASLAILGWGVAIAPWTIRNYRQFGELVYIRGGFGIEVWLGACPEAGAYPAGVYAAHYPLKSPRAQQRINEIGEAAFIADYRQEGRAAVAADPARFLRLTGQRAIDFWFGATRTHAALPEPRWWPRSPQRLGTALFLSAETVLAVLGLLLSRNRAAGRWLMAMALAFSIVYCTTHIELRYRTPIEPVLAILVGLTLSRFWGRTRSTGP